MGTTMFRRVTALALGVAVAAGASVAAAPANAADAYDDMRDAWVERLTGGDDFDPTSAPYADQVAAIDSAAEAAWDALDLTQPEIWPDLDTAAAVEDITEAYRRAEAMGLAFRTHGSDLEGDTTLASAAVAALDWLETNRYSATTSPYGNWWHWQIGIPLELHRAVALLYDQLTSTQRADMLAATAHFSPAVTLTGANRVWKALVVGARGVLGKSSSELSSARTGVVPALEVVASGDGFHADGSFIQHTKYAYTGGYGLSFLQNLVDLLALLAGSAWEVTDPAVDNVYEWIAESYDPFLVRGALMDTVRGREISRQTFGEHDAGRRLIQTVVTLAEIAPPAEQAWLKPMLKQWIASATLRDPLASGPLFVLSRGEALMADSAIVARPEPESAKVFPDMGRVSQRAEGYAAVVSMVTPSIAPYESINGENLRGFYTGDGSLTVYTDDDSQFSEDYWATAHPYRVPGTTIDTMTRASASGAGYLPTSSSAYGGGVESASGRWAVASYSLDAWNSPLVAKKSWYFFDDEIVALGSGISAPGQSGTGWNGQPRAVQTIVEARKLQSSAQQLVVDGTVRAATTLTADVVSDPDWAHLEGVGGVGQLGYVFPGTESVTFYRQNARSCSWSQINSLVGSSTTVTEDYMSVWLEHGSSPSNASYRYIELPGATEAETSAYAASPDAQILADTTTVHAVRETSLGVTAATFWGAGTLSISGTPLLSSTAAASIIVEDLPGGGYAITVADPTAVRTGTIDVELYASGGSVVSADTGVTVSRTSPTIRLSVDVTDSHGAGFTTVIG
ncbi:polysaccharide lyase 8 family protein [Homoserinibacter sp. GY 40078]|uniref:polysaccharide lyase 8 family protein n=1 Tax=Homoserinibacter sp. GY 40078 TaxID=2603275 RepID=UPI0011C9FBCC|nr:polysaccharide lyase 8 family protein [Homoserinibacter sp. GY 40078]TXK16385.1 polysaccharide lyase 8 family protein [Homoserinibacter sp. GY 40078]